LDIWLSHQTGFPLISVIHVFFLSLCGYLFVDHDVFMWKKTLMYIALTGAVLGVMIDPLFNLWPLLPTCAILFFYNPHWLLTAGITNVPEIRKLPGIKNIAIALCWILIAAAAMLHQPAEQPASLWWMLFANVLFIAVLSIAEDMLDAKLDEFDTLLIVLGKRNTIRLCFMLLVVANAIALMMSHAVIEQISFLIVSVLAFALLLFLPQIKQRALASFLIDGAIVLKGLIPLLYYTIE
jgi:4-hydroxybenzoate polyprenyltransferase